MPVSRSLPRARGCRLVRLGTRVAACVVLALGLVLADRHTAWAVATIPEVITNLRNWIIGISAGLATLFFTFGGLRYLMAGGDPGEIEAGKRALKAAAVGYGIAILAPIVTAALKQILEVN